MHAHKQLHTVQYSKTRPKISLSPSSQPGFPFFPIATHDRNFASHDPDSRRPSSLLSSPHLAMHVHACMHVCSPCTSSSSSTVLSVLTIRYRSKQGPHSARHI
ncbi:hypothetical protein EYC84_007587 [Monilinia fructicola]|uniref:Uncharacterized protein n=1 Tax=Monilinia fructicola TaxID=38448 RepID=A0A5M9JKS3_MONFR|nr:hypothetical protein EYC84_007587 [Monilinia fructicola]